jgi:hypothetical protein
VGSVVEVAVSVGAVVSVGGTSVSVGRGVDEATTSGLRAVASLVAVSVRTTAVSDGVMVLVADGSGVAVNVAVLVGTTGVSDGAVVAVAVGGMTVAVEVVVAEGCGVLVGSNVGSVVSAG